MMDISDDAVVFGAACFFYIGQTLSFGGAGAEMQITDRARAALDELVNAGYVLAEVSSGGREAYLCNKLVRHMLAERGLAPFGADADWDSFVPVEEAGGA